MKKVSSESVVKDIRRRTRKKYSSEEKIRIIIEAFQNRMSAFGRLLTTQSGHSVKGGWVIQKNCRN